MPLYGQRPRAHPRSRRQHRSPRASATPPYSRSVPGPSPAAGYTWLRSRALLSSARPLQIGPPQFIAQHTHVDRRVHRIARPRVRQLVSPAADASPGSHQCVRGPAAPACNCAGGFVPRVTFLPPSHPEQPGSGSSCESVRKTRATRETQEHSTANAHPRAARPRTPAPAADPAPAANKAHRETKCFGNAASHRPRRARP